MNDLTIQSGYVENRVRALPDEYRPVFMIKVWAKTGWEMALISAQVLQLFPKKGAITVTRQDGSQDTCNMWLDRTVTYDSDNLELSLTEDEQRPFGRGFVYVVEGYQDNTTDEFGIQGSPLASRQVPTVLERLLEIDSLMHGLVVASQPQVDLNTLELQPITG